MGDPDKAAAFVRSGDGAQSVDEFINAPQAFHATTMDPVLGDSTSGY